MIHWAYLGRVPYEKALALQLALRERLLSGEGQPTLLLLEHPPTVTLGRRAKTTDLRVPEDELAARGVDLVRSDRGGLITYHGPGQLVGYPIVDLSKLGLGVHEYVSRLSEGVQHTLRRHNIEAHWSEERPGLWLEDAKIASFGVHVHHNVTTHGFALNVQLELSAFDMIVACGHTGAGVTSMASLRGELWCLDHLATELAEGLGESLGLTPRPCEREEVWAQCGLT